MSTYQYRLAKRDGQLVQQRRFVECVVKAKKWWKPWEYTATYEYQEWYDVPIPEIYTILKGDRVKVKQTAGFHTGATGLVEFVEPNGKVWVLRDNSGSPVYYHPDELELIWRPPSQS